MSSAFSYMDFFPRHSFGEVKVHLYSRFDLNENEFIFHMPDPIAEIAKDETVFLLYKNDLWDSYDGSECLKDFSVFRSSFAAGVLEKGGSILDRNQICLNSSKFEHGFNILSDGWRRDGIRHVDFIERAIPIPDEHDGFHDYVRRWCERELKDQGYDEKRMEMEDYHNAFLKIGKPIRYHFFLSEETGNEPDCYFKNNRFVHPPGCPVFEDLLADKLEFIGDEPYWGPVWQHPEYPHEHSVWMWIERKDTRLMSVMTLVNRSGKLSLMLVPFYFSLLI